MRVMSCHAFLLVCLALAPGGSRGQPHDVSGWEFENLRSLCVGPFQLTGLGEQAVRKGPRTYADGAVIQPLRIRATSARVAVFRPGAIVNQEGCVNAPAVLGGALLSAEVVGGEIELDLWIRGTRHEVRIPPGKLNLMLRLGASRTMPLLGGSLDRPQQEVSLSNPGQQLVSSRGVLSGAVELRVPDARLSGVTVSLGGQSLSRRTSLGTEPGRAARFRLGLPSGRLDLVGGTLVTAATALARNGVSQTAGLEVRFASGSVAAVRLSADAQGMHVSMGPILLTSAQVTHTASPRVSGAVKGQVRIERLEAAVPYSTQHLGLTAPELAGVLWESDDLTLLTAAQVPAARAKARVQLSRLTEVELQGVATLSKVLLSNLPAPLAATLPELVKLELSGRKDSLAASGPLTLGGVSLGPLAATDLRSTGRVAHRGGGAFDFQVNASAGALEVFRDAARTERMYSGQVASLKLAGSARPGAAHDEAYLVVPEGGFQATVKRMTSHAASLMGGTVSFVASDTSASNILPLTVSKEMAGAFRIASASIAVEQARFTTEEGAATLQGRLSGDAELVVPAGGGPLRFERGHLGAADIVLRHSGLATSGLSMSAADVRVRSISLVAEGGSVAFTARDASFEVGTLKHAKPPVFSGQLAQPATLEQLTGTLQVEDKPPRLDDLRITKARLAMRQLHYSAERFAVTDGAGTVELEELTLTRFTGRLHLDSATTVFSSSSGSGQLAISNLALSLSGEKSNLSGEGHIAVGGFELDTQVRVPIGSCTEDRDRLRLDIQAVAGTTQGGLAVRGGRVEATLMVSEVDARIRKPGSVYTCQWNEWLQIEPKWVSFHVPCPSFRKPFRRCLVKTKVTPGIKTHLPMVARVLLLNARARIRDIKLQLGGGRGLQVCEGYLRNVRPIDATVFHVNPQLPPRFIVTDAVNVAIAAFTAPVESSLKSVAALLSNAGIGGNWKVFNHCD